MVLRSLQFINEVVSVRLKSINLCAVMLDTEFIVKGGLEEKVLRPSVLVSKSSYCEDGICKSDKENSQGEELKEEFKVSINVEVPQLETSNDLLNLENEYKHNTITTVECCKHSEEKVVSSSFLAMDRKIKQKTGLKKRKKPMTMEKKNIISSKKTKTKRRNYEKPSDQVLKVYQCTLCPKVFQRVSHFNSHQRHHNNLSKSRPFSCQDCKHTFVYRCQLRDHIRVHTGERPFKCHHCSKTFARKGCLVSHMITHSNSLPYECDTCHKRFARKYNLAKHLQSHSGERPFHCGDCSRRFKCKQSLDKHLRIHELSIYSCSICQTTFDSKRRLTNHKVNEHVSYRPFLCQICQKPFIFKSQLTYHIKEHNLERPYSCVKCNKSYFKKGHLLAHIKQYCSDSDNESETIVKVEISN